MARLPLVAIIGRPNTGKSTLFNRLIGRRVAIENPVPGTTRDHIIRKIESDKVDYLLVDTGGMGGGTEDKDFEKDVHAQSLIALKAADLILFTVDGRSDLTGSDREIIAILRKQRRGHVPVILVVTKCDTEKMLNEAEHAFHDIGIAEETMMTSAAHNVGTEELQDAIERQLKKLHFGKKRDVTLSEDEVLHRVSDSTPLTMTLDVPRIAIIGRPNVGKSSIINAFMSDPQRKTSPKLVSDIPGTTRDATDTIIRNEDAEFILVDTAGLRRKSKVEEDIEGLSVLRTIQAIEDADVAVLVIDASERVSRQDKTIAGDVIERGKGLMILVNKIDLLKADERKEKIAETKASFPFCRYAPIVPVSAKTRENLPKLFPLALSIKRNRERRFPVKELKNFLQDVTPGQPMGALASCKHMTQAKDPPPTFVLFVKNPKTVQVSQLRYLENRMRERFGLEGTPVKWITKGPRD